VDIPVQGGGGGWNGGDDSEMGSRCGRKGGVDECYVNY